MMKMVSSTSSTRLPDEAIAVRGEEIYESQIRQKVEAEHYGKVVAIDVTTGEYEIGPDALEPSLQLLNRLPNADIWCVRVGHQALHHIGARSLRTATA